MSSSLTGGTDGPSSQARATEALASRLAKELEDWASELKPQNDSDGWGWALSQGHFEWSFEDRVLSLVNRPGDAMTRQRLEQQYRTTNQAVADMDRQCTDEGLWSQDKTTRPDARTAAQESIRKVRVQVRKLANLIRSGFPAGRDPVGPRHAQGHKQVMATAGLKKLLRQNLKEAKDYAFSLEQSGQQPQLLPKPTKAQLTKQLQPKVSRPTVSRCFRDSPELRELYARLDDLGAIMGRGPEATVQVCPSCGEDHSFSCQADDCPDRHDGRCKECHAEKVHGVITHDEAIVPE